MQNRYFGDVGDYGKYSLLRALTGQAPSGDVCTLGVVWYLFPDEGHNEDGRHISYLQKAEFRKCDPPLYDGLKKLLADGRRAVEKIQSSGLLSASTIYFDDILSYDGAVASAGSLREARLRHRAAWLSRALSATKDRDLVFLDPDNGFQVKSVPRHTPKAPKYVFWDEAAAFHKRKHQSLVMYHHLNRSAPASVQLKNLREKVIQELGPTTEPSLILFRRGSLRVYVVVPSKGHEQILNSRLKTFAAGPWSKHCELQ